MMRICCVMLALLCLCAGAAAQDAAAFTVTPLYDAPGVNAQELMRYNIGTRVEVIRDVDAQFVQVNVGSEGAGLMGYMRKRDLEFGEANIRAFRAELVTYRNIETQTCRLYSYPDKGAPVIDDAFDMTLIPVIGFRGGEWVHVRDMDGATGFVALDELEGETPHYAAAPYIAAEPMETELSRKEALEAAKEQLLKNQPEISMEKLEACAVEMDVLYYYETPGMLTYTVIFRNRQTGYVDAGVSFLVEGKEIVKVSFGNG